mgnify:FL=1
MLNENRIRLMFRMASYEEKQGQEDLKISTYYRKDYTSMKTLATILWLTFGYVLLILLLVVGFMDILMKNITLTKIFVMGAGVVIGYIVLLILYGFCSSQFYRKKYNRAKKRMRRYYRDLGRLEKFGKKEK